MNVLSAVREEANIWANVYLENSKISDNWLAFAEPEKPSHPHWNLLIPLVKDCVLTSAEIQNSKEWFSSLGCQPHLLDLNGSFNGEAVSQDWYFGANPTVGHTKQNILKISSTEDLSLFATVLGLAFELPKDFPFYFSKKMSHLRQKVPSIFYLAQIGDKYVGCWSTFRSSSNYQFMMNFGMVPDFKGQNLSGLLMDAVVSEADKPIFTHTTNVILAEKLLPRSGFQLLGQGQVKKIGNET